MLKVVTATAVTTSIALRMTTTGLAVCIHTAIRIAGRLVCDTAQ